ncbi:MAG TPA: helix-turn-helix domain-containing protein [Blastocatellia bacterium]|nr:helix-turn-helix domain-containing protein [Blastocatellia bacterium]
MPGAELAPFVEHFWAVRWDLRNQEPRLQESLPYPCVHLVFGNEGSRILGVVPGKFSVLLKDRGQVFGVKFKPGGFYPFYRQPLSRLTGRSIPPEEVFGIEVQRLREAASAAGTVSAKGGRAWFEQMVELASALLRNHLPEVDPNVAEINRIVDCVVNDREITLVEQLIDRLNLNKRALQRLFSRYAGVSPKWVIQRYRLHEAIERLDRGKIVDWATLALDLGYFDQAHFIKDFKAFTGKSPAEYARLVSSRGNNDQK